MLLAAGAVATSAAVYDATTTNVVVNTQASAEAAPVKSRLTAQTCYLKQAEVPENETSAAKTLVEKASTMTKHKNHLSLWYRTRII